MSETSKATLPEEVAPEKHETEISFTVVVIVKTAVVLLLAAAFGVIVGVVL